MEPDVREAGLDLPRGAAEPRVDARRVGRRAFRIALVLLPVGVLANIAWLLLATDRALLASLGELPRAYLLVALALTLVPWLTGTGRIWIWTRFLGYRLPLRELFRLRLVVDVGSAISPTAIGGEAFQWGMLMKNGVRPGPAGALALLPKIEDALFIWTALPIALVWSAAWRLPVVTNGMRLLTDNVLTLLALALAFALAAWLVSRGILLGAAGTRLRTRAVKWWGGTRRRLRRTRHEAWAALRMIGRDGRAWFALSMTLTAIQWIARYSVVSALALFLGVTFDPVLFWALQWVVFTIMSFVPTPGAAGGAEVAFAAVYAPLLPGGAIGIATAAWRMFTFYVPVGLAALAFALTGGFGALRDRVAIDMSST